MQNWKAVVISNSELSEENKVTSIYEVYGDDVKLKTITVVATPEEVIRSRDAAVNLFITNYEQSLDPNLVPPVGEVVIYAV